MKYLIFMATLILGLKTSWAADRMITPAQNNVAHPLWEVSGVIDHIGSFVAGPQLSTLEHWNTFNQTSKKINESLSIQEKEYKNLVFQSTKENEKKLLELIAELTQISPYMENITEEFLEKHYNEDVFDSLLESVNEILRDALRFMSDYNSEFSDLLQMAKGKYCPFSVLENPYFEFKLFRKDQKGPYLDFF